MGQGLFGYFCGCLTKVSRRKGGARKSPLRIEWICTQTIKSAAATHQIAAFGSDYTGLLKVPLSTYPFQACNRHIRFALTASPFWQTAPKGTKRSLPYHPAELA